jgi:hypothetical protein
MFGARNLQLQQKPGLKLRQPKRSVQRQAGVQIKTKVGTAAIAGAIQTRRLLAQTQQIRGEALRPQQKMPGMEQQSIKDGMRKQLRHKANKPGAAVKAGMPAQPARLALLKAPGDKKKAGMHRPLKRRLQRLNH